MRYADLVIVDRAEAEHPDWADWELIVVPLDEPTLEHGAYVLDMVTLTGDVLRGEALLVRSVEGTIVLRGAGPLIGHVPGDDG